MLLVVIAVDRLAMHPVGVYLITGTDASPFAIGTDKEGVLIRINEVKSIRKMATCAPESCITLNSRRGFSMTPEMTGSRAWTLMDRQKGVYWLRFDPAGVLDRILFLNDPDREGQADLLSLICDPGFFRDPARVLSSRTGYRIFSR